jgi:hypothetical protein
MGLDTSESIDDVSDLHLCIFRHFQGALGKHRIGMGQAVGFGIAAYPAQINAAQF